MTEDEAKTKWCPQAEHRDWKCIGSACMAWRWEEGTTPCTDGTRIFGDPEGKARPAEGFCGLAGRP
jgi:hypothetical protein